MPRRRLKNDPRALYLPDCTPFEAYYPIVHQKGISEDWLEIVRLRHIRGRHGAINPPLLESAHPRSERHPLHGAAYTAPLPGISPGCDIFAITHPSELPSGDSLLNLLTGMVRMSASRAEAWLADSVLLQPSSISH